MAITSPTYAVSGVSLSSFNSPELFNGLNSNDRSYFKDLVMKFGPENYSIISMALGNFADIDYTDNHTFYHYEKRQLHASFAVASQVASTGAGNAVTVTVGSNDYYLSGTQSPIRAGETMRLESSGVFVEIVSVSKSTANAHTAVIKPLDITQNIASAGSSNILAGDIFTFRGATNVGEGSTALDGKSPIWDKITNTITEHRDDFTITDIADMEKQEIMLVNGKPYYRYIAIDDINRRYLNEQSWKIMEGVAVTNTGLNANIGNGNTNGTKGVIPFVQAGGSTVQWTAANGIQIGDFQALARQLSYYGSASEYHLLMDLNSKQAFDNFLFTTYKNTYDAASYESVGKSKEASAAYGFDTFRMNGITWHSYVNPQFTPDMVYKRPFTLGSSYNNFSLAIPQKQNLSKDNKTYPSFQIIWQRQPNGNRVTVAETGLMAPNNKTTTANRTYTQIGYYGVRVFGANGYAIFQGV